MLLELPTLVLVVGLIPILWSGAVAILRNAAARGEDMGSMRLEASILVLMITPVAVGALMLLLAPLTPTTPLATLRIPGLAETPARPSAGESFDPWPLLALAVVALYLAGLAASSAWLLLARAKLDRIAAAAVPCPALGEGVRLSAEAAFPFASAYRIVVLPRTLVAQLSPRDVALVLRHERAHLARRDPASFQALAWIDALFWHNPLVRRQTARCRLAAELACDAAVVATSPDDRPAYASALVAAVKHAAGAASRLAPSITSTRNTGDHHMRLIHILKGAPATRSTLTRAAVAAATVLLVPLGGLQLAACAPGAASTQTAAASPGVIRAIDVEGNQAVSDETVLSHLTIEPGQSFDPVAIDVSLRALFASGLFSDIAFERRGDVLVVRVVETSSG
jgi:hypothetical protein